MEIIIGELFYESLIARRKLQCRPRVWGGLMLIVVSLELGSMLCDMLVDPGHFFDFAITFPGYMEFYTLDSLFNSCLMSLACGGWFGHDVFLDVVSRREVMDCSSSVSSPNLLDCIWIKTGCWEKYRSLSTRLIETSFPISKVTN